MEDGSYALISASKRGNKAEVLKILRKDGKNVLKNTFDDIQQTPLHIACEEGYEDLVNLFLQDKYKMDVNSLDSHGWTPLHSACKGGNTNVIETLLNRGAFVRALTDEKSTPLHYFVRSRNENPISIHNVLTMLIKKGNPVDSQNQNGESALHQAALSGRPQFVLYLLNIKANPNLQSVHGETPLHYALKSENSDCVNILLRMGADPQINNAFELAWNSKSESIRTLIQNWFITRDIPIPMAHLLEKHKTVDNDKTQKTYSNGEDVQEEYQLYINFDKEKDSTPLHTQTHPLLSPRKGSKREITRGNRKSVHGLFPINSNTSSNSSTSGSSNVNNNESSDDKNHLFQKFSPRIFNNEKKRKKGKKDKLPLNTTPNRHSRPEDLDDPRRTKSFSNLKKVLQHPDKDDKKQPLIIPVDDLAPSPDTSSSEILSPKSPSSEELKRSRELKRGFSEFLKFNRIESKSESTNNNVNNGELGSPNKTVTATSSNNEGDRRRTRSNSNKNLKAILSLNSSDSNENRGRNRANSSRNAQGAIFHQSSPPLDYESDEESTTITSIILPNNNNNNNTTNSREKNRKNFFSSLTHTFSGINTDNSANNNTNKRNTSGRHLSLIMNEKELDNENDINNNKNDTNTNNNKNNSTTRTTPVPLSRGRSNSSKNLFSSVSHSDDKNSPNSAPTRIRSNSGKNLNANINLDYDTKSNSNNSNNNNNNNGDGKNQKSRSASSKNLLAYLNNSPAGSSSEDIRINNKDNENDKDLESVDKNDSTVESSDPSKKKKRSNSSKNLKSSEDINFEPTVTTHRRSLSQNSKNMSAIINNSNDIDKNNFGTLGSNNTKNKKNKKGSRNTSPRNDNINNNEPQSPKKISPRNDKISKSKENEITASILLNRDNEDITVRLDRLLCQNPFLANKIKEGSRCQGCKRGFHLPPLTYFCQTPHEYDLLSDEEKETRSKISADLCSIDNVKFFIRALLELPINMDDSTVNCPQESTDCLVFGVWVQVETTDFFKVMGGWKDERILTMKGTINNCLPFYMDSYKLPVILTTRKNGLRPVIKIEQPSNSDLAIEQIKGISPGRLVFLIENMMI